MGVGKLVEYTASHFVMVGKEISSYSEKHYTKKAGEQEQITKPDPFASYN